MITRLLIGFNRMDLKKEKNIREKDISPSSYKRFFSVFSDRFVVDDDLLCPVPPNSPNDTLPSDEGEKPLIMVEDNQESSELSSSLDSFHSEEGYTSDDESEVNTPTLPLRYR